MNTLERKLIELSNSLYRSRDWLCSRDVPVGACAAAGVSGMLSSVGVMSDGTDIISISGGGVGPPGPQGPVGPAGPQGIQGEVGPAGPLAAADFYALMPPDNAATVAPGAPVFFPQDGPNIGSSITRSSASSFNLATVGTYMVQFQVSVDEAGQLVAALNGVEVPYTVVGRATGTSQIVGVALITTTVANTVLTVRNPAGNPSALTITPLAGGASPASAHLVIVQLA